MERLNEFIEKINKLSLQAVILILGAMLIIIGAGLFYWLQVRSSRIFSQCHKIAHEIDIQKFKEKFPYEIDKINKEYFLKDDYDFQFKACLRGKGLNIESY
jgi:uncharacterized protein HemX